MLFRSKRLIATAFGVVLLLGGSIAFAGGYVHTSDDSSDETEQSQEVESPEMESSEAPSSMDISNIDAPGQQVARGDEYEGEGPRGLEVAQIAHDEHDGAAHADHADAPDDSSN